MIPKWEYTDAVDVIATVCACSQYGEGVPALILIREGTTYERCDYREEGDGTFSLRVLHSLRTGIPATALMIALQDPCE